MSERYVQMVLAALRSILQHKENYIFEWDKFVAAVWSTLSTRDLAKVHGFSPAKLLVGFDPPVSKSERLELLTAVTLPDTSLWLTNLWTTIPNPHALSHGWGTLSQIASPHWNSVSRYKIMANPRCNYDALGLNVRRRGKSIAAVDQERSSNSSSESRHGPLRASTRLHRRRCLTPFTDEAKSKTK